MRNYGPLWRAGRITSAEEAREAAERALATGWYSQTVLRSTALRDLNPGDVVNDYGTHRVVAEVNPGRDGNGYPIVAVVYEDGETLTHEASHKVEVVG